MKLMTMRKARQLAWSLGIAIPIAETLIHHWYRLVDLQW
jgi:hypothetical protein